MTGERDYSQMSSQELNSELRQLFGQLPSVGLELIEEDIGRRAKSEHRQVLMERLRKLLIFSPTTSSFRDFVLRSFSDCYDLGVAQKNTVLNPEYYYDFGFWILDMNYPESGGIFDPQRAIVLEREAFRYERRISLPFAKGLVEGLESQENPLVLVMWTQERWRQEFIEKYGDEP